ncbi:MAG: DUF452 family protein, partial [Muribaculaceae bacterium]|nr:DUF452 family protein [Muribaculaceae bacterium]
EATLSGLTPDSLERFNRRMCGSASAARSFAEVRPARDIESLRQELQAIGDRASEATPTPYHWDIAVIGQRDMIFPPAAQRAAWQGHDTIELDAPHLPGFQHIIDHLLIKKDRVAHSFESSRDGYEADAGYQHSVADLLVYKLLSVTDKRHFSTAIEIGAGSGRLTAAYCNALTFDRLELWDIAPAENACLNGLPTAISITDDAEVRLKTLPDDSVDLIISASTLQWFNSPANGVRQIERVLRPGGLAAIALYVDGTYESFSREIGATLRYSNTNILCNSLSHSDILLSESIHKTVSFDSTAALLRHISHTGVSSGNTVSPATLRRVIAEDLLRELEYATLYLIFKKS